MNDNNDKKEICSICDKKKASREIGADNLGSIGVRIYPRKSIPVCEKCHRDTWEKIDRKEGLATLLGCLLAIGIPIVGAVMLLMWLF